MNPEQVPSMNSNPDPSEFAPQPSLAKSRALIPATLVLVALPLGFLCALVYRYWVNIPLLDDWEMAPLIVKARSGELTFADIFVQHAEARNVFPKLLFVLFAMGSRWDVRVEMAVAIFFCCITVWLLYLLLRKSLRSQLATTIAIFLMALLVFSPAQHELWLLASGFYSFLPALCLVMGLVIVQTRLRLATKFALCAVLAVISSFTLAHGLLAWGLTFPMLFLQPPRPARCKSWLAGWTGLTCACVILYSYGYRQPKDLPPFAPATSPLDYAQYLFTFIGSAFGRSGTDHPLVVSQIVGALLLLLFLGAVAYVLKHRSEANLSGRAVPWIALGLYGIGSGCLAALGRIAWGVPQALESRYVAFAIYVPVALIALVPVIGFHRTSQRESRSSPVAFRIATAVIAVSLLVLHLLCSAASVDWFRIRSAATRLGHGATLFSQVLDTSHVIKVMMYPRPDFLRFHANALDRLHLLKPPLIRTKNVREMRHGSADGNGVTGWWDALADTGSGKLSASGWAALKTRGRPADCVVLAHSTPDGEVIFAISEKVEHRGDVARSLGGGGDYELSGWRATFSRDAVPAGATISAWAVDAKDAKLFRLKEGGVEPEL